MARKTRFVDCSGGVGFDGGFNVKNELSVCMERVGACLLLGCMLAET